MTPSFLWHFGGLASESEGRGIAQVDDCCDVRLPFLSLHLGVIIFLVFLDKVHGNKYKESV